MTVDSKKNWLFWVVLVFLFWNSLSEVPNWEAIPMTNLKSVSLEYNFVPFIFSLISLTWKLEVVLTWVLKLELLQVLKSSESWPLFDRPSLLPPLAPPLPCLSCLEPALSSLSPYKGIPQILMIWKQKGTMTAIWCFVIKTGEGMICSKPGR